MTIVVTGATGHVGANLVRELLTRGEHVRVLVHRDRRALQGLDVEILEGDVCDADSLSTAFRGADVVYHLAARISLFHHDRRLVEAVNITGVRNVVQACLDSKVRRLVHFSSIHAIEQEPLHAAVDETRPLVESHRCPPYDRSKAGGEMVVRDGIARGLNAVIISPTAVVGPFDFKPSDFGAALIAMACGGIPALVEGGFDWVDVRDVVDGALRAAETAPAGAKFLLSGHWAPVREIAALVQETSQRNVPGFVCPMWLARAGAPVMTAYDRIAGNRSLFTSVSLRALRGNRSVSHAKAARELGYAPRLLRETVTDAMRWFDENGYLTDRGGKAPA